MDTPLRVESRREGTETAVIALTGEVDVASAPAVREEALHLIEEGVRRLVFDLEGIEYMDSAGLGTLVGVLKRLRESGGQMAVAGARDRVQRLFQITGLEQVFTLCADVPTAVKEVGG